MWARMRMQRSREARSAAKGSTCANLSPPCPYAARDSRARPAHSYNVSNRHRNTRTRRIHTHTPHLRRFPPALFPAADASAAPTIFLSLKIASSPFRIAPLAAELKTWETKHREAANSSSNQVSASHLHSSEISTLSSPLCRRARSRSSDPLGLLRVACRLAQRDPPRTRYRTHPHKQMARAR